MFLWNIIYSQIWSYPHLEWQIHLQVYNTVASENIIKVDIQCNSNLPTYTCYARFEVSVLTHKDGKCPYTVGRFDKMYQKF